MARHVIHTIEKHVPVHSPKALMGPDADVAVQSSTSALKVIGVFGLPTARNDTFLNDLKTDLDQDDFLIIDDAAFEDIMEQHHNTGVASPSTADGLRIRTLQMERAMSVVHAMARDDARGEARRTQKHVVVSRHYATWDSGSQAFVRHWSEGDTAHYTHILYLEDNPEVAMEEYRKGAETEMKTYPSAQIIHECQQEGRISIWNECCRRAVPYMVVRRRNDGPQVIQSFVEHTWRDCVEKNMARFQDALGETAPASISTAIVLNADKTLSTVDTAHELCEGVDMAYGQSFKELRISFGDLGSSPAGAYQAILLFKEAMSDSEFLRRCTQIAARIVISPDMVNLLTRASTHRNMQVVVVTSGLEHVWTKVFERYQLRSLVVLGTGTLRSESIVTSFGKRDIVQYLQTERNAYVWAIGGSPEDLPMLNQADQAIISVCNESDANTQMEQALRFALDNDGLEAQQVLFPSHTSRRLFNHASLPVTCAPDLERRIILPDGLRVVHATNTAAGKMLTTVIDENSDSQIGRRQVQQRIGFHLATTLLPQVTGMDSFPPSADGNVTHTLRNEIETIILHCSTNGDAIADGVMEVLSSAKQIRIDEPDDLRKPRLAAKIDDAKTIIVCDVAITDPGAIIWLVEKIRQLSGSVRIVILAVFVAPDLVKSQGGLAQGLATVNNVTLVALSLTETTNFRSESTDTSVRLSINGMDESQ